LEQCCVLTPNIYASFVHFEFDIASFHIEEQTIAYDLCQLAHPLFLGTIILINLVIITFAIQTILVKSLLHIHLASEVVFQD